MKVGIVTDAWRPQTNGVVTTLARTAEGLVELGHTVTLMTPEGLPTIPCPTYPEIRLALFQGRRVAAWLEGERPDTLHIATEGPLGLAARNAAVRLRLRFTTSYHTQFPRYLRARYPLPECCTYALLRAFHGRAARTMVGTRQVRRDLRRHGFRHLVQWGRGVDTQLFRPRPDVRLPYPRPILIYVGRVAVEKSVEDFCRVTVPGTKLVVGDGPALAALQKRYPEVVFAGFKFGEELGALLAGSDCFVFPSRTDTFGLVMLEAMASGLPVAAYPVTGPIDVVREGESGSLSEDLVVAIKAALTLDRGRCRAQALEYRWENATRQFLGHLVDARGAGAATVAPRGRLTTVLERLLP
ncbi:MAG TPA: glycosyltransferase family 1 protein [Steroidobacteraceae bacterium]|nr:glycosyltransferase family 1 protein [Steroidobacteraceae bacterium]